MDLIAKLRDAMFRFRQFLLPAARSGPERRAGGCSIVEKPPLGNALVDGFARLQCNNLKHEATR